MFRKKILLVLLVTVCPLWHCDSDNKSSLVFVIDETGSMLNDIGQVKTQVDSLFESAILSNASHTEDFVIVTFNDPGSKHHTTTKDKVEFMNALANIRVHGGGDCPELAMEGLELALQHSRNGSLVYLFTDADAKDFDKYEAVKTAAKQKNCRLHFVLTGTCEGYDSFEWNDYNDSGHRVFFDLAETSGGQVFSLYKQEVGAILSHARASIAGGYGTVVASNVISGSEALEAEVPAFARYGAGGYSDGSLSRGLYTSRVASAFYPESDPVPPLAEIEDYAGSAPSTTVRPGVALEPYRFNVTENVKDLLVSVSGFRPMLELIGPEGTAPKIEDVVTTSGSKVIRIIEAKPGQYTAKVTSLGRTSIVISGNDNGAIKSKSELHIVPEIHNFIH